MQTEILERNQQYKATITLPPELIKMLMRASKIRYKDQLDDFVINAILGKIEYLDKTRMINNTKW